MLLSENKKAALLILAAFIFSFAVRLIWVNQFSHAENFKFKNEFMINTNDGYFWAEGARDILKGSHEVNDLSPVDYAASQLTAFFAKVVPVSFETLIFYLPAFLSSLIVIPILLIGRSLHHVGVGFIAALIGSIAWSYYNRTMIGYYDTDMLTIVFPTFLLWSLIWAVRTREEKYLLFTGLIVIGYQWWYLSGYALEFAFAGVIALYSVYLFVKKQEFKYELKLIAVILVAMTGFSILVKLAMVAIIYLIAKKDMPIQYVYAILGVAVALFIFGGGIEPVWAQVKGYIFREVTSGEQTGLKLQFFNVAQTVREAGQIPFETFANRISGATISFFIACIGYVWMAYRYRVMLIALPMVGLGFLAYGIPGLINGGGLRFTVYAVPVMALGTAFLIVEVSRVLSDTFFKESTTGLGHYTLLFVLTALSLYPNIRHVQEYMVPTVFNTQEVEMLDKLGKVASREDYVVSWWDYGYPIRYYSDVKTLVDGAKHNGDVNFPVSWMLSSPVQAAAKLARFEVEYTEKQFHDENLSKKSTIELMTLDQKLDNTNDFLALLETDIKLPAKTRDIYFYLPYRMLDIYPTVMMFSNLDLMNGKKKRDIKFYPTQVQAVEGNEVMLANGILFNAQSGVLSAGGSSKNVRFVVSTEYVNGNKLQVNKQFYHADGEYCIVFLKSYNRVIAMDSDTFNSLYVQMFMLENYDPKLFEPVQMSPYAKIYKLKV